FLLGICDHDDRKGLSCPQCRASLACLASKPKYFVFISVASRRYAALLSGYIRFGMRPVENARVP
ncbi:MAG: hypothetical protein SOX77_03880, partial [Candidatus Borkfalkiaceae bacterium]|nr:hypothetical protein [Christensenellaceae bacterium]